jgi:hypothetical protein
MYQDLMKRISGSIERLLTLEIVTAVGTVDPTKSDDPNWPDLADIEQPQMIVSKFNLLDGDIRTIFGEAFVTGDYKSLVDYHTAREKQGFEIINNNIAALKALLQLARGLDDKTEGGS